MTADRRRLRIAGVTRFSSIDYPGKLACVAFLQGCPLRCLYCHNPQMQPRDFPKGTNPVFWDDFEAFAKRRVGLLDAVVFSGGEPCVSSDLADAAARMREIGMAVGLHTSGFYPGHLRSVLPHVDWVGLDVKADPEDEEAWQKITGMPGAAGAFAESLDMVLASKTDLEVRMTVHPDLHTQEEMIRCAKWLASRGVEKFALQVYRREGTAATCTLESVPYDWPSNETLYELATIFGAGFVMRRDQA